MAAIKEQDGLIKEPVPDEKIYNNFFGRMVKRMDGYIEADPVGVLLSLVSYSSAAIGGKFRITTIKGPLSLHIWGILSGESGEGGKGDATNAAKDLINLALPGWTSVYQKNGFDTGYGMLGYMHDTRDGNGIARDLFVFQSELSAAIAQLGNDARMRAVFTKLFDRDTLSYASGKDRFEIYNPYCVMLAHVQPELFIKEKNSKATVIGCWNRFLFARVGASKELDLFGSVEEKEEVWAELATELYKKFSKIRKMADNVDTFNVKPTKAAALAFARHHRPTAKRITRAQDIKTYVRRGDTYVLKLAALYALFDGRTYVTEDDFDSALAMVQYSCDSVRFTLTEGAESSGRTGMANTILRYVGECGGSAPLSKVKTKCGNHNPTDTILRAINELVRAKLARFYTLPYNPERMGRPNGRYVALIGHRIPDDAVDLDPLTSEPVAPPAGVDDEPDDVTEVVDAEIVVEEVRVVKDEPQTAPQPPQEARKALPAPQPPKRSKRASAAHTAAHKTTQANGKRKETRKETTVSGFVSKSGWF